MRKVEYSPFPDVKVPYIDYLDTKPTFRLNSVLSESLRSSRMPFITRYILYRMLVLGR